MSDNTGTPSDASDTSPWAIVVAGGSRPPAALAGYLQSLLGRTAGATVIAADSGWDSARSIGLLPEHLVGDLDSISVEGRAEASVLGAQIHEHHPDKDRTDTEIALDLAVSLGVARITAVLGGDRIDHLLAALHVVTDPARGPMMIDGFVGTNRVTRVVPGCDACVSARVGATISLLPVGGTATGVSTTGLRWALDDEVLSMHSSRGVSNIALDGTITVSVTSGTLLVVEPDFLGHTATDSAVAP